jgi:hypothetical protein
VAPPIITPPVLALPVLVPPVLAPPEGFQDPSPIGEKPDEKLRTAVDDIRTKPLEQSRRDSDQSESGISKKEANDVVDENFNPDVTKSPTEKVWENTIWSH